jgi:hypothetical protein
VIIIIRSSMTMVAIAEPIAVGADDADDRNDHRHGSDGGANHADVRQL